MFLENGFKVKETYRLPTNYSSLFIPLQFASLALAGHWHAFRVIDEFGLLDHLPAAENDMWQEVALKASHSGTQITPLQQSCLQKEMTKVAAATAALRSDSAASLGIPSGACWSGDSHSA